MASELTIQEVLDKAIEKEKAAQSLYSDLSQKVRETSTREALLRLVQQEKGHQLLLEQYQRGELKGGMLSKGQTIDYKIAECLDQPEISPEMKLKEVFLLAANREKASHEFYTGLAGIHSRGKVKSLLLDLAAQELKHKQIVETVYNEVAFPQTSGG
jgi:rubrerythrin